MFFNKYFSSVNECSGHNSDSKAIEKLGDRIEQVARDEIKSKDRVNISLEEYEQMKKQIETLERKNSQRDKLIIQLGIPAEVIDHIHTSSIRVQRCEDIRDFKCRYHVHFDVDTSPDLRKEPGSWL